MMEDCFFFIITEIFLDFSSIYNSKIVYFPVENFSVETLSFPTKNVYIRILLKERKIWWILKISLGPPNAFHAFATEGALQNWWFKNKLVHSSYTGCYIYLRYFKYSRRYFRGRKRSIKWHFSVRNKL